MSEQLALAPEVEQKRRTDFYSLYAREALGMPDGWIWDEITQSPEKAPKGFFRMTGVVVPLGPRTGRPNWRKADKDTERTVFVAWKDFEAWQEARGRERDECPRCDGSGETIASAGVNGTTYRPCRRCDATGRYVSPTPTEA